MGAWRHARAIALLPGTVAVVVPAILIARNGAAFTPLGIVLGAPLVAGGFAMWVWTVLLFARIGKGPSHHGIRPSDSSSMAHTHTSATR